MAWLLTALSSWPIGPDLLEQLRSMPEWKQARAWEWIMASGELTGTGSRHAGGVARGILPNG
jgi:hypothetical protein